MICEKHNVYDKCFAKGIGNKLYDYEYRIAEEDMEKIKNCIGKEFHIDIHDYFIGSLNEQFYKINIQWHDGISVHSLIGTLKDLELKVTGIGLERFTNNELESFLYYPNMDIIEWVE